MRVTIDPHRLARESGLRGLTLAQACREAGLADATAAKIGRGQPVRPSVARRLEETLERIPVLQIVQLAEEQSA